ncbi:MAG: thiamine phosphate synthase [Candidatus Omnitrophica bacterium]|nr:thiamine phosphate synthase [Candidatus Omnitrophota bacterium]
MKSKKRRLKGWKIYAIVDETFFPDTRTLLRKFRVLIESPVDVIQLRCKKLFDESFFQTAGEMARLAKTKGIPFIINDRPDIALMVGASGVHLGKGDVSPRAARNLLGPGAVIGRTIRNVTDLKKSGDIDDIDYVAIGPVFETPLKPSLRRVSPRILREAVEKIKIPVVAIGGINDTNVHEVIRQGIRTVAFVRYALTYKNTKVKIEKLRKIIRNLR